MNVSVPGGGHVPPDPVLTLLERLLELYRSGQLGGYEAELINRIIRWLRTQEAVIDRNLIAELKVVVVKAPLSWKHVVTLGDTIKELENYLPL